MSEYSWKSSGVRYEDRPDLQELVTPKAVGFKTPLRDGSERSGIFEMNYSVADQVADNFRNLVMTNYGERLGNPSFGANLRPLVTDYTSIDDFESAAMERIQTAVTNFLPAVELDTFVSKFIDDNDPGLLVLELNIKYNIPKLNVLGRVLTVTFTII